MRGPEEAWPQSTWPGGGAAGTQDRRACLCRRGGTPRGEVSRALGGVLQRACLVNSMHPLQHPPRRLLHPFISSTSSQRCFSQYSQFHRDWTWYPWLHHGIYMIVKSQGPLGSLWPHLLFLPPPSLSCPLLWGTPHAFSLVPAPAKLALWPPSLWGLP